MYKNWAEGYPEISLELFKGKLFGTATSKSQSISMQVAIHEAFGGLSFDELEH